MAGENNQEQPEGDYSFKSGVISNEMTQLENLAKTLQNPSPTPAVASPAPKVEPTKTTPAATTEATGEKKEEPKVEEKPIQTKSELEVLEQEPLKVDKKPKGK